MSAQSWTQWIAAAVLVSTACRGGVGASQKATEKAPIIAATPTAIEGTWKVAEFRLAGGPTLGDPASQFIFSGNNYSLMFANVDTRAAFTNQDVPTDPEKIGAFDSIIANAGTYDIADDTLVIHPIISKHPGFMGGGEDKFLMRTSGDTLWLTSVAGAFRWANGQHAVPEAAQSLTLVRAR